ncbi:MAG: RDD family protein [Chitinophagaceae bacterium]
MALLQVKTPFNIELNFQTASFHSRLFAWIVDGFIMNLYRWGMSLLFFKIFDTRLFSGVGIYEIMVVIPMLLYHFIFELFNNGQSLGKMLFGIKVINLNGEFANVSQCMLRWLLRFFDLGLIWGLIYIIYSKELTLGLIMMLGSLLSFVIYLTSKHQQRLGDFAAGTTVVLKKLPYKISDTIFQEFNTDSYQVTFPQVMRLSDRDINIIHNILQQHEKSNITQHIIRVADKIKSVLQIETDMPEDSFLEILLKDYNYLSKK